jgi:hypothetical protein
MRSLAQANTSVTALHPRAIGETMRHGLWIMGAVALVALTLSSGAVTLGQMALASLLLGVTIRAYLSWAGTRDTKIPVWPLLCGAHFIYYGLAIFSASRVSPSRYDHEANLLDSTLTKAMLVGIVGLLSIAIGRKLAGRPFARGNSRLNLLSLRPYTPARIHALLLTGLIANVFGIPFFGTALWNVSVVFLSTIPLAAFLWVILASATKGIDSVDRVLASAFFITRLLYGARFGASLGTVIAPTLLMGLAAVSANRRLPWRTIAAVAVLVLFLQPSKGIVRDKLTRGDLRGNAAGIMLTWVETAASGWADVLAGRVPLESQLSATTSRTSLLTMTGLILEKTPNFVPFQNGVGYTQLLQNLVPRLLWPDKPTVSTANQFFQVEYGLTAPEDLASVSMACGFEAEGYMNFGWLGTIVVGLLIGVVFRYYENTLFSLDSSVSATAVGLALLLGFLSLESQLVQYLGGVVQVFVAACVVFWDSGSAGVKTRRGALKRVLDHGSEARRDPLTSF